MKYSSCWGWCGSLATLPFDIFYSESGVVSGMVGGSVLGLHSGAGYCPG